MILLVYSIRDVKTETFSQPFYQHSRAAAIRTFSDLVKDPQSTVNRHPEDFALYEIGSWNDEVGVVASLETPLHVVNALDYAS